VPKPTAAERVVDQPIVDQRPAQEPTRAHQPTNVEPKPDHEPEQEPTAPEPNRATNEAVATDGQDVNFKIEAGPPEPPGLAGLAAAAGACGLPPFGAATVPPPQFPPPPPEPWSGPQPQTAASCQSMFCEVFLTISRLQGEVTALRQEVASVRIQLTALAHRP
jgi:hypothetical protein